MLAPETSEIIMGKYGPLQGYLSTINRRKVAIGLDEIEKLVGPLPAAAQNDDWWTADSGVQAKALTAVGWRVRRVDHAAKQIVFETTTPRWVPTAAVAMVSALCAGTISLVGVAALPKWALFVISFDMTIVLSSITWSVANKAYRTYALSVSNASLALLLVGIVVYHFNTPSVSPSATARFVRTESAKPLVYGHSYQVLLGDVHLPLSSRLWIELATPLERVGPTLHYSFFYTQASPELGANNVYYLNVTPNNTARRTEDILTALACPADDNQIVSGNSNRSLRKTAGCQSLDYMCIIELNNRPKYGLAPFAPPQCRHGRVLGLPVVNVEG